MEYPIVKNPITRNFENTTLNADGMVVHETATPGATALNIRNAFQRSTREASAHYAVDWDTIIEIVPPDKIAWHACYTANHRFIGIELCHPRTHDEQQFNTIWARGIWLFAYLFVNLLNITAITKDNLMSHAEVSEKWHETTHVDPVSYFAEYGRTVDQFRAEVQQSINSLMNGGDKVDGIIICFGDGDLAGGLTAHYLTGFPITFIQAYNAKPIQAGIRVHVGGPIQVNTPQDIYCGGADRAQSIAAVLKAFKII